jgi:protoporphyrinogen oxidase
LRAKLGENYEKVSAAFIWAIIARMYAARRTGLKKEMFGYVPGGYAQILERFAEVLAKEKVRVEVGHVAKKVEPQNGRGITVAFGNGHAERFDQIVLTMASPIAAAVCPDLSQEEKSRLHGVRYQGIICASLLLKQPLANFYVTNITDSWVPFTAVIEMTALIGRQHFGGSALVYLPKYVAPDDAAFSLSDQELEKSFVTALLRMYRHLHSSDVLCFRVSRVRYVLALSTLNYSERLPPMVTSVPGIHIVNSAHICHGTLNVNETVQLAEKAAIMLLRMPSRGASAPVREGLRS